MRGPCSARPSVVRGAAPAAHPLRAALGRLRSQASLASPVKGEVGSEAVAGSGPTHGVTPAKAGAHPEMPRLCRLRGLPRVLHCLARPWMESHRHRDSAPPLRNQGLSCAKPKFSLSPPPGGRVPTEASAMFRLIDAKRAWSGATSGGAFAAVGQVRLAPLTPAARPSALPPPSPPGGEGALGARPVPLAPTVTALRTCPRPGGRSARCGGIR